MESSERPVQSERDYIWSYIKFTPTTVALLASNLITIILAWTEGWTLLTVMWIYWFQSVMIGFFGVMKILCLKDFDTGPVYMKDEPIFGSITKKSQAVSLLVFHYGLFHVAYLIFLVIMTFIEGDKTKVFGSVLPIVISGAIMAGNHAFSFLMSIGKLRAQKPKINGLVLFPYARIIPMHLMIVLGFGFIGDNYVALVFFMGLKTLADMIMHQVEHANYPKGQYALSRM